MARDSTDPSREVWEGITYFDHPSNPQQPTLWHVRDDGWMEASFNQRAAFTLAKSRPLTLRYLLHVNRSELDPARAELVYQRFIKSAGWELLPRTAPHRHSLKRREG